MILDLEYLPESLERIYCQGTKLVEELVDYKDEDGFYNYQTWRKDYRELIKKYPFLRPLNLLKTN